jgi:hypothetical protein
MAGRNTRLVVNPTRLVKTVGLAAALCLGTGAALAQAPDTGPFITVHIPSTVKTHAPPTLDLDQELYRPVKLRY